MIVNGKQIARDATYPEIQSELARLPSSFSQYNPTHPDCTRVPPKSVTRLLDRADRDAQSQNHRKAVSLYTQALAEMDRLGDDNNIILGDIHYQLAVSGWQLGNPPASVLEHLQACMMHYINAEAYDASTDVATHMVGLLQRQGMLASFQEEQETALVRLMQARGTPSYDQNAEIQARKYLAAIAEMTGGQPAGRMHRAELFDLQQGPMHGQVAMVGEREVGFSDSDLMPLATTNIQQCMVVIVRDPKTNKTAMAHFNYTTDPASLDRDVFDKFPPDAALEVRLVGSKEYMGREASDRNITQVMNRLRERPNVIIKSADIWEAKNPTAIIYYPESDSLVHGIGSNIIPNQNLHTAVVGFYITPAGQIPSSKDNIPLNVAFNLTNNNNVYFPIALNSHSMECLQYYLDGKREDLAYEAFIDDTCAGRTIEQKGYGGFAFTAVVDANKEQTHKLVEQIAMQVSEFGIKIDQEAYEKALLYSPKYIGEGADSLNQPLVTEHVQDAVNRVESQRLANNVLQRLQEGGYQVDSGNLLEVVEKMPKYPGVNTSMNDLIPELILRNAAFLQPGAENRCYIDLDRAAAINIVPQASIQTPLPSIENSRMQEIPGLNEVTAQLAGSGAMPAGSSYHGGIQQGTTEKQRY